MRVFRHMIKGALVGLAVVASCSGAPASLAPTTSIDLAIAAESSPCGGGELQPLPSHLGISMRRGFERWPLPPVFVSVEELDDNAVACFDGSAVLVHRDYMSDRVIVAHEYCHAIAALEGTHLPEGFPTPNPISARAQALEQRTWEQEIWAVSCSTAVTGERDWSWGHLVDDSDEKAQHWAADYVAAGPTVPPSTPDGWSAPVEPRPSPGDQNP